MGGLIAWVEGSGLYTLARQLNRGLWRLWLDSVVGRAFNSSLRALWRRSGTACIVHGIGAWMRQSFVISFFASAISPQPSAVTAWLQRVTGPEREMFRATSVEKLLLYFVVFFVPIELWLITLIPTSAKYLGDLALAALLVGTLIRVQQAGWPLRRTPADLPVLLLLAVAAVSTLWNAVPLHIALFGVRAYVEYYALYLVLAYIPLADRERRALLLWFIVLGVAIAIFGDAQRLLHVATPRQWLSTLEAATTRAFGTMGNPNTFGAFLVGLLALLMSLLVMPVRGGIRFLALAGIVIAFPALAFTLSREALVAAAITALCIGIIADRRVLILVVVAALALPLLDPHVVTRFAEVLSGSYIRMSSSYGRILFWERGLQAFLAQPLVGWGPGRFGGSIAHIYGSPVYQIYKLNLNPIIDSQHVQTLVELGILGYIAYLWLGVAAWRAGLKLFHGDRDPFWRAMGLALAAGTLGLWIQSLFASLLETHQVIVVFWMLFGMVAYRLRTLERARSAGQTEWAETATDQVGVSGQSS